MGTVARDLDLTESALRQWVERAHADRVGGRTGLTSAEREELGRLRKENRRKPPSSRHCEGDGAAGCWWPAKIWWPVTNAHIAYIARRLWSCVGARASG